MPPAGRPVGAPGRASRRAGLMLAATPAELAGAVVTAEAARAGRVEPLRPVDAPLDVLCQQLIGMACGGEWSADDAFALVRKAGPMADLTRADFDACLAFLAGDLAAPAGAFEPEPGAAPRWTSPRIWKRGGLFGVRSRRVIRWFWSNVGTITSEESVRVLADGDGDRDARRGLRRAAPAGRPVRPRRPVAGVPPARGPDRPRAGDRRRAEPAPLVERPPGALGRAGPRPRRVPRRGRAAARPTARRRSAPGSCEAHDLDPDAAAVLEALFEAQEQVSEIPGRATPARRGVARRRGRRLTYTFHAPLGRSGLRGAGPARPPRGWAAGSAATWRWPSPTSAGRSACPRAPGSPPRTSRPCSTPDGLRRRRPRRARPGRAAGPAVPPRRGDGLDGPARTPRGAGPGSAGCSGSAHRLYPLVKAACPDHPLLRETRREVLETCSTPRRPCAWLASRPGGPVPVARRPLAVRRGLDRPGRARAGPVRVARRGAPAAPRPAGRPPG